jgi:tetratricopeptide (TPR) repeat protein
MARPRKAARPRAIASQTAAPAARDRGRLVWLLPFFVLVTLAAYAPAWRGGPLWDDDAHLTSSALQSTAGLGRIWFDVGATQQYYPVAHSAFWLMHRLWGDDTLGYHLVNIVLHAVSAFLIVVILRRLAVPGAWLAGLLFAVHPVHVESVAWMTELKNTLSGVLYLGAALAYLRFDETRARRPYVVALSLFVLALLAKTVTATLPAVVLVVFWWKRGRLRWREDVLPLAPFFAAGIAGGIATAWIERTQIGAEGAEFQLSLIERGLIAGRAFWFYLAKIVWPLNLMFNYPRWEISTREWWQYLYPVTAIALFASLWLVRGRTRAPLAAMLIFAGTLFPALGFLNVYPFRYSFVADHFQYLASISVLALLAAGVSRLFSRVHHEDREEHEGSLARPKPERLRGLRVLRGENVAMIASGLVLAIAASVLTWRESRQYVDADTLYRTTIARNPSSWLAHQNLGWVILGRGRTAGNRTLIEGAVAHFQEVLRLRPDLSQAHNNLGTAFLELDRSDEAKAAFDAALREKPDDPEVHCNLSLVLQRLGRFDEAVAEARTALRLRPQYADASASLGNALQSLGRQLEAIQAYRDALQWNPNDAETHHNLGSALGTLGRLEEAAGEYQEALRLRPDSVRAHRNLGLALLRLGRPIDAIARFTEAVRLAPTSGAAYADLARALDAGGRRDEAVAAYRQALRLQPGLADAHNELGVMLAELGRIDEAILEFQDAVRLAPESADARANLARALAMRKAGRR